MNKLEVLLKRIYSYKGEIIGFWVLVFFYNRTHLCIAMNLPKLGEIESWIKVKSFWALTFILVMIIYSGIINCSALGYRQYFISVCKRFLIQFVLYFATILLIFRSAEYLFYGAVIFITIFAIVPALGKLLHGGRLFDIEPDANIKKTIISSMYRFFGEYGLIFGAAWFYTLVRNPALMIAETAWNNFIKNQIVIIKSSIITLIVAFMIVIFIGVVLERKSINDVFPIMESLCNRFINAINGEKEYWKAIDIDRTTKSYNKKILVPSLIMSIIIVISFSVVGKMADWNVVAPVTDSSDELLTLTSGNFLLKFLCGIISITDKNVGINCLLVIFLTIAIRTVILKYVNKRPSVISLVVCVIFGVNQVFGISMIENSNCNAILANGYQFVLSLISIIGFSIVAYLIYAVASNWVKVEHAMKDEKSNSLNIFGLIWKRHMVLISSLLILSGYMPYLLMNYPGSVDYDTMYSIEQFFTMEHPSVHHPVLTMWIFSFVAKFGQAIIGLDKAVFAYILIQTLISALIFTYIIRFLKDINTSVTVQIVVACTYALTPMYGIFAQNMIKDSLFYPLMALFVTMTARILLKLESESNWKYVIGYVAVALLTCLFRYNGLHIIVPTMVITGVVLLKTRNGKIIILGTIALLIVYKGVDNYTLNDLKYTKKSSSDALSICTQQMACYIKEHPDDITSEEIETIDKVIAYEYFQYYLGYKSDSVKVGNIFRNPTKEDISNYIRLWITLFMRHPISYVEAFYAQSCGYYTIHGNDMYYLHAQYVTNNAQKGWLDVVMDSEIVHDTVELRWISYFYAILFERIPLVGILECPGFYFWILIFCILFAIDKKMLNKELIIISIPLFLSIGICCVSPINSLLRYAVGYMASIPILVGTLLYTYGKQTR